MHEPPSHDLAAMGFEAVCTLCLPFLAWLVHVRSAVGPLRGRPVGCMAMGNCAWHSLLAITVSASSVLQVLSQLLLREEDVLVHHWIVLDELQLLGQLARVPVHDSQPQHALMSMARNCPLWLRVWRALAACMQCAVHARSSQCRENLQCTRPGAHLRLT